MVGKELKCYFPLLQLTAPVTITSLTRHGGDVFTINCLTTGSPATTVEWLKFSTPLGNDDTYQLTQELVERTSGVYNNLLIVRGTPDEVIGLYTCTVENSISSQSIEQLEFQGNS